MTAALAHRLDRRRFVDDALVVQEQQAPRLRECEALSLRAVGLEHARLAALDAFARDKEHRDQVHAVAVRALGRGPADAAFGVDAELVRFDEPGPWTLEGGAHAPEPEQQRVPGR